MNDNKIRLKKYTIYWTIILCLVLAGIAIYSAIIGASKAKILAHKPSIVTLWITLCVLILAGLFIWKRLVRNIGLFAMHIGCVLVVAGAIWGSQEVHRWREDGCPLPGVFNRLSSNKDDAVPYPKESCMIVHDSQVGSKWEDPNSLNLFNMLYKIPKAKKPTQTPKGHPKLKEHSKGSSQLNKPVEIAELTFSLKCNKIWRTYYQIKNPWTIAIAKRKKPSDKMVTKFLNPSENNSQDQFDFALLDKPGDLKKLTNQIKAELVESFLPSDFENPTILIFQKKGKALKLKAKAGNQIYNPETDETLIIKKVYKNFRVREESELKKGQNKFYDAPGGYNPAAIVDYYPGKPGSVKFLEAKNKAQKNKGHTSKLALIQDALLVNSQIGGACETKNQLPNPVLISRLPRQNTVPACIISFRITVKNKSRLIVYAIPQAVTNINPACSEGEFISCFLESPLTLVSDIFPELKKTNPSLSFCVGRYPMKVKNYFIDMSIIKNSEEVKRKIMTINDPLHYGGFFFYINKFSDPAFPPPLKSERYSAQILVRSDAGVNMVFAGFAIITLGLILKLWGEPIIKSLKKLKSPDSVAGDKLDAPKHQAQIEHLKEIEVQVEHPNQANTNSKSQGEQA